MMKYLKGVFINTRSANSWALNDILTVLKWTFERQPMSSGFEYDEETLKMSACLKMKVRVSDEVKIPCLFQPLKGLAIRKQIHTLTLPRSKILCLLVNHHCWWCKPCRLWSQGKCDQNWSIKKFSFEVHVSRVKHLWGQRVFLESSKC